MIQSKRLTKNTEELINEHKERYLKKESKRKKFKKIKMLWN